MSYGQGGFGQGSYGGKDPSGNIEAKWNLIAAGIIIAMAVAFIVGALVIASHKAIPEQTAQNPWQLRNMSRECVKQGGSPVTRTIYNKPIGEPDRQPVKWTLKCKK